jgi:hypothetical protein
MNTADASQGLESSQTKENRRNSRLLFTAPIEVRWQNLGGPLLVRQSLSQNVGIRGALLILNGNVHLMSCHNPQNCRSGRIAGKDVPGPGSQISLTNSLSKEVAQARAIRIDRSGDKESASMGIEMAVPNEAFWGLTFQLQRTAMRLLQIERAFQGRTTEIDFRILRSLRDAVENLWNVSSAVQEWHGLRAHAQDPYSVLETVSGQRVNRAAHLLRELAMDIDSAELTSDTQEFTKLSSAVDCLYKRITRGPATKGSVLGDHAFKQGAWIMSAH